MKSKHQPTMKQRKLSILAMLAVAVMSSCSNDNELSSTNSEYVNSVRVTVEDFLQEGAQTRTAYTVDGSGFHFSWVEGDALGIYPVGGDQVKFPISNGDGSATATFDGGAWKLRSEYKYAAYYPFSVDNYKIDQKALPVSFIGQTQNGNGSTAHLGAYDYLACAATAPDASGGVDLTMKHLGAFLRLQLTMPKADTYSSVVLESNGAKFVTTGTFDLTAATPAINPTATSSTYTINLTNVATTEKDQVITVYAIVAPADLSAANITVTVHGEGQTTYVQTVQGKNFVARSAYNIAVDNFPSGTNASGEDVSWEEPSNMENGHEFVDLGLSVKWATCNVGANKPEEYGDYYAWGETETKKSYSLSTYKWCNGSNTTYTKYCTNSSYGTVDNKTTLEPEDDVAHVKWGGKWRMPSTNEQRELCQNCNWTWKTINGINGYEIRSMINDNSIFLPAGAMFYYGAVQSAIGSTAQYCSSNLNEGAVWELYFSSNSFSANYYTSGRWCGYPVRPVCF